ncbi:FAD-binding oxidoreductase [Plantactinospora sp. CA-290183]|uniref:FAD-binding oxidoreductase n=1 Tax=Plantactinospora sp. CA-290183 TaxID=3240006 RepID=UPI003D931F17
MAPRQRGSGFDIARRLAAICGDRFARPAGAADGVAGAPARWVAAPGTPEAVTEVLRLAAEHDLSVVARGAGTKLDWGATPSHLDIVLDTGRLAGVRSWPADELAAEIGAGTPIRAAQAILERAGRRLPLDVPSVGATVGGVVAAAETGPLRHLHGTPCDQLLGASFVDAAGALTHVRAASRVEGAAGAEVPALARRPARTEAPAWRAAPGVGWAASTASGTDVARLLCGSQGALGVLVSATLRVQPIPASRIWVTRSVWTPLEVHDLVSLILTAEVDATAIEVDLPAGDPTRSGVRRPGASGEQRSSGHPAGSARRERPGGRGSGSLAILLEGGPADVSERVSQLAVLLGDDVRAIGTAPPWWRRYPFRPDEVALRIEVPITDLHAAVYALRDAAGAPVPVRGSAGLGVVHAALPADTPPDRVAAILDGVRSVLLARAGRCVVVAAPPPVRAIVDLWGDLPDLPLLRRVKERFDPAHRLAPGRYPGGI